MFYLSDIGPNPMRPAMSLFRDRLMGSLVSMVTRRICYLKIGQAMKEETGQNRDSSTVERRSNKLDVSGSNPDLKLGREQGYVLSPNLINEEE